MGERPYGQQIKRRGSMKKQSTGICELGNLRDATAYRMSSTREGLIYGIKMPCTPGRIFVEETISSRTMSERNVGFKLILVR